MAELAFVFLKLGVLGFGGPAAHIAMMEDEVVEKRRWLPRDRFLDLVGATNLIPGPNSTEMAIHVGYLRCGWIGLLVAGVCFILPAALITVAFAWLYVEYGSVPEAGPFTAGIRPAVVAIIFAAVWRLGRSAIKGWQLGAIGVAVSLAAILGLNEIIALVGGGLVGLVWLRLSSRPTAIAGLAWSLQNEGATSVRAALENNGVVSVGAAFENNGAASLGVALEKSGTALAAVLGAAGAVAVSLSRLGVFFLTVGSILYGSGYVLVAFLEGTLVDDYGWLTQQQLFDAIAIGQFTPGPVLSTATLIGYLVAGVPGAVVATVAIFLPSFVFVAVISSLLPRLRMSKWAALFLDAVNVSAVALMAAVTAKLAQAALVGWPAWTIAIIAAAAALRFRVNAAWLVVGGGIAGWLLGG